MTTNAVPVGSPIGRTLSRLFGPRQVSYLRFVRRCGWRYGPIAAYREVPGWLSEGEALRLFDLARGLRKPGAVAVEIGSWLGRSSIVIAKALAGKPGARLYCVDPWNADGEDYARPEYAEIAGRQPLPLHEQFRANVRRAGVEALVHPLRGYSADVGASFADAIDLLFIDANHDYPAVLEDFRVWAPRVAPGGVIAFHDADHAGPRAVIEEFILGAPGWTRTGQVDSLFHAQRLPGGR